VVSGKIVNISSKIENKISETTRQEIIDLINMGFCDPGTSENIRINWNGKLEESTFLSRIYDLSKMKSTDSRFSDATGDIWQHRVNNYDWDDDWVFYDSRFTIKTGSDENLLNFLSEMFHPAVRDESKNWEQLLKLINDLLRIDGYELSEKPHTSGKTSYKWQCVDNKNVVIQSLAQNIIQNFDSDYIRTQVETIITTTDKNPYDAIGKSKELLETCCKTILKNMNISTNTDWDVIKLTKETCGVLKLTPDNIDNATKASETIKKLLGNLSVISQSMAELRNSYGSGHGKDAKFKGLTPRHARLSTGASLTAVNFLWETFNEKHGNKN
jgi:predicted nucleic acid-binding protein